MRTPRFLLLLPLLLMTRVHGRPPESARPAPWSAGLFTMHDSQPYRGVGEEVRVFPFVSYRGERLRWYGPYLQYTFLKRSAWSLSAHAGVQFPAYEEDDSEMLNGLGDRSTTLIAGLDAELSLSRRWKGALSFDTEAFGAYAGVQATAAISRSFGSPRQPISGGIDAGVLAQNKEWTRYHVGVPEDKQRPDRPAYSPDASLHPFVSGRVLHRVRGNWSCMLMLRAEFLDDTWRDSPLVADEMRYTSLLTLSYSF